MVSAILTRISLQLHAGRLMQRAGYTREHLRRVVSELVERFNMSMTYLFLGLFIEILMNTSRMHLSDFPTSVGV